LNSYYNGAAVYAESPYQATQDGSNADGNGPNALVYDTSTLNLLASVGVGTPEGSGNGEYRQVVRYEFQPVGDSGSAGIFYSSVHALQRLDHRQRSLAGGGRLHHQHVACLAGPVKPGVLGRDDPDGDRALHDHRRPRQHRAADCRQRRGRSIVHQPTTPGVDIHVGGITLSDGAGIDMVSLGAARSHSNHNVLVVGPAGAPSNPTFSVDSTSTLNMEDNDLIVHTGGTKALGQAELAALRSLAYGAGGGRNGGKWTGDELTSSTAAARRSADRRETTQLAAVLNNDLASRFSSWVVGSASEALNRYDIIVKYTYTGDFNLAGMVTATDSGILGLYYNSSNDEWADGDTNDDGSVNATDAGTLGLDFGNGTSSASIAADQIQL